jgi:hypothetical protein
MKNVYGSCRMRNLTKPAVVEQDLLELRFIFLIVTDLRNENTIDFLFYFESWRLSTPHQLSSLFCISVAGHKLHGTKRGHCQILVPRKEVAFLNCDSLKGMEHHQVTNFAAFSKNISISEPFTLLEKFSYRKLVSS